MRLVPMPLEPWPPWTVRLPTPDRVRTSAQERAAWSWADRLFAPTKVRFSTFSAARALFPASAWMVTSFKVTVASAVVRMVSVAASPSLALVTVTGLVPMITSSRAAAS